ncbi:MAG: rRNA maturation RNase YbeY [Planctomycetota bacterium]|jgi:probable rRNA maturation factor
MSAEDGLSEPVVEVSDRQELLGIDPTAVDSLVRFVLREEEASGTVEVVFVDDAEIADLHLRFLAVEGPTDVITFPLPADEAEPGSTLLGEIVVSTETAIRQAPEYGNEPLQEALLYVVHGVLHLLGYDDHDEDEAERMAERQQLLLGAWSRTGSL